MNAAPADQGTLPTTGPGPWRILLAAGSLLGPALITIATALDWTGGGPVVDYLTKLQANPGVYLASGLLLVFGMALLPLTAVGLFRAASGRSRATLLRVGAVLLAAWGSLAIAGVSAGYSAGWVSADLLGTVSEDTVEQVFNGVTYGPWGFVGGVGGGAAFVLGIIALGIGVLLVHGLPRWSGIAILVSIVLSFAGGPTGIHWIPAFGMMLLTVGIVGLVPAMLAYGRD